MYATNGPFKIVSGGFGSACVSIHRVAKFTGSLAAGDRCKPKNGDWVMEKNSAGYVRLSGSNQPDRQPARL
jgi:hypothetical protein